MALRNVVSVPPNASHFAEMQSRLQCTGWSATADGNERREVQVFIGLMRQTSNMHFALRADDRVSGGGQCADTAVVRWNVQVSNGFSHPFNTKLDAQLLIVSLS